MGRNLNFSINEYYHIYNRGVEKRIIFLDENDHKRFIFLLFTANSDTPVHLSNYKKFSISEIPRGNSLVDIGAWCLMPNHFHLLIKEKKENGISLFMKKLLTGYSMYFNTKYERKGNLFERPFKAKHLDTDDYLKYQYTYIHLNPLNIIEPEWKREGIKNDKKAQEFLNIYKHSSFFDYVGKNREEKIILEKSAFPNYFESSVDFKEMLRDWINFNKNIKESP